MSLLITFSLIGRNGFEGSRVKSKDLALDLPSLSLFSRVHQLILNSFPARHFDRSYRFFPSFSQPTPIEFFVVREEECVSYTVYV